MNSSDVAIVLLNYYPPPVVERAINSIVRQSSSASWTLYLGFHDRPPEHRDAVRELCAGLPVHFVTIDRDLIFDVRARDVILQEALRTGDHRFLFFLDDDDEWLADYLERMTAPDAPFITCAKEVMDDATERTWVSLDHDYESMGFRFGLWRGKRLPFFVKQWSDKYIHREFSAAYPDHPHVDEPLYRIHQHEGSLTFQKSLGRSETNRRRLARREVFVVTSTLPEADPLRGDCARLARVLDGETTVSIEAPRRADPPRLTLAPLPALADCCAVRRTEDRVLAIAHEPAESLLRDRDGRAHMERLLNDADALLLCDPGWVDGYEAVHPRCLPVGLPSSEEEADVESRAAAAAERRRRGWSSGLLRVAVSGSRAGSDGAIDALSRHVGTRLTLAPLEDSHVHWASSDAAQGWGRDILRAYELGIPSVSDDRTTTARILHGATPLLVDSDDHGSIASGIRHAAEDGRGRTISDALPFYRRCFGPFYWLNSFMTYVAPLLEDSPEDSDASEPDGRTEGRK